MTDSGSGSTKNNSFSGGLGKNASGMSDLALWSDQSEAVREEYQELTPRQKSAVLDILKRMSVACHTRGSFFDSSGLDRLIAAVDNDVPSMDLLVDPYLWPRKLASRQAVILGRGLLKNISERKEGRQLVQNGFLSEYGSVRKAFKIAAGGDLAALDDVSRALEVLRRDRCGDPIAENMAKSIDYVCACLGSKSSMAKVAHAISEVRSEGKLSKSVEDVVLRATENGWRFLSWSEPGEQWDTASEFLYLSSVDCDFTKDDLRKAFPHQRFGEWFTDSRPVVPETGIGDFLKSLVQEENNGTDSIIGFPLRSATGEIVPSVVDVDALEKDLISEIAGKKVPSVRVIGEGNGALGLGTRDFENGRFDRLLQPLPLIPAPDPDFVYETLMAEFPWMEEANETVAMACAVSARRDPKFLRIAPMMLVGPSGAGKSRWSRRMAEVMDVHYHRENMAGMYGTMEVSGNAHGWKDARPSLPSVVMAAGMIANPIILLDEIDKTAAGTAGDPVEALLPMLEGETAKSYSDPCLMVPVDVSMISFLFTANSESELGTPFMDRLTSVRVSKPTVPQFEKALPSMLDGVAAKLGIAAWGDVDGLLDKTLKVYVNGGSLRSALSFAEREMSALIWCPKKPGSHLKLV